MDFTLRTLVTFDLFFRYDEEQYEGAYRYKYHLQKKTDNVYVVRSDMKSGHVIMIKEYFTD